MFDVTVDAGVALKLGGLELRGAYCLSVAVSGVYSVQTVDNDAVNVRWNISWKASKQQWVSFRCLKTAATVDRLRA